jgi:hypothetical protein
MLERRINMLRRLRPILIGVPLVLAAWFASMVTLTWFASAGVPVAVVAPGGLAGALAAVVAADGAILQVRGDTVIAISDDGGFVARLYRAGALIVVQASGGCGFSLQSRKAAV